MVEYMCWSYIGCSKTQLKKIKKSWTVETCNLQINIQLGKGFCMTSNK